MTDHNGPRLVLPQKLQKHTIKITFLDGEKRTLIARTKPDMIGNGLTLHFSNEADDEGVETFIQMAGIKYMTISAHGTAFNTEDILER